MYDRADVLLIFPPQTEARFFPYLSLPYLTGHLRRGGRNVHQADLNIALLHDALGYPELLDQAVQIQGDDGIGGWYRRAMADVVIQNIDELRTHVLEKAPAADLGAARAVRLAHHAVELLVRGTFLARTWVDLIDIDDGAQSAAQRSPADLGAAVERLYRGVETLLERHRPRVVGLSVPFFSQLAPALLISAWIRRLSPAAEICLGGQQIMLRHEDLARLPGVRSVVDALCWTAGEQPLARWLDALDGTIDRAAVPGMIWLSPSAQARVSGEPVTLRFRDLGPPDYDGLPARSYLNQTLEAGIVSCVGCYWGRCVFCSYGNRSLAPGSYQQGTVAQIADAVQAVVRSTGATFVAVSDENTNLRLIVRAMREVRARGVAVGFGVRSRLDSALADPEFCRSLADVGCELISAGYEGTSQRLLDLLDRGVTGADYQCIIENVAAAGIVLRLSVMGNVLDETAAEFGESLDFLRANEERIGIDVLELLVAEPGSLLVRDPDRYGLSLQTGALAGNPELSYLSGRVGLPLVTRGGPDRTEALDRLVRVFDMVSPGQEGSVRPSRPRTGRRAEVAEAVQPHRWVRSAPPGLAKDVGQPADTIVMADLVWERLYALPRRDVQQHSDDLLTARTSRGQRLLADLVDAGAGVLAGSRP